MPDDTITETEVARQAARQRAIRARGAQLAGVLEFLRDDALRVELESHRAEALDLAYSALHGAFGTQPFEPKKRGE